MRDAVGGSDSARRGVRLPHTSVVAAVATVRDIC